METQVSIEGFQAANQYLVNVLEKELTSARAQLFDALRELDQARADLAAAEGTRIDQTHRLQSIERGAVGGEMLGLATRLSVPVEAEPEQILADRRFVLGPAAGGVDVLEAQQEAPAEAARQRMVEHRREGVAEVEEAVGAGGEAGDGIGHRHRSGTGPSV